MEIAVIHVKHLSCVGSQLGQTPNMTNWGIWPDVLSHCLKIPHPNSPTIPW